VKPPLLVTDMSRQYFDEAAARLLVFFTTSTSGILMRRFRRTPGLVIEDGQVFLTHEGKISVNWKDDKSLQVTCDGCPKDREPTMESSWNDVSISYELH
jgi:hypothetical protein